jgi:hypothetical protein
MAFADDEDNGPVKPKNPTEFVKTYGPVAAQVAKDIGVDARVLLGQWGMETGWGKSIIGDHNLGNIKDANGLGIRAHDKREGSNDAYLSFEEPEDFARYYSNFIKRGYPEALNAGTDASKYVSGLANGVNGSYFGKTDPKEYEKLVTGAQNVAEKHYEPTEDEAPKREGEEVPNGDQMIPNLDLGAFKPVTEEIDPAVGAVVGGVAGGIGGAATAAAKAKYDLVTGAYDAFSRRSGQSPVSADDTPGGKWGAKTGYGKGSGSVQDVSSKYQRAVGKGKVSGRMDKLFGIAQAGESPQLTQRLIDRAKAVPEPVQNTSKLSKAANYLGRLGALPIKHGAMGAMAGFGALDAYNRYNKGESGEATIGGLGTAASLVAPYVGSMGALPAAGIAAPLYLTASDRIKRLAKNPDEIRLQEDNFDAMGNPLR